MSDRSFKKMLKRRGPSMEPCGTPVIVCIHKLVYLKGNFSLVLDCHDLNHKHAV